MSGEVSPPPLLATVRLSLLRAGGPDLGRYRPPFAARRVLSCMRAARAPDLAAYAGRVARDPSEARRLARSLCVGVTRFRRDPSAFEHIEREVLPALCRSSATRLAMLSAGTSTGEEAWSLAIAGLEHARRHGCKRTFRVLGFDLDPDALGRARAGTYAAGQLAAFSPAQVHRWFRREGDSLSARPELRAAVRFVAGSVLDPPVHRRFDVVLCRNVLMYLAPEAKAAATAALLARLRPGGYLMLGRTEHLAPGIGRLRPASNVERVFQLTGRAAA